MTYAESLANFCAGPGIADAPADAIARMKVYALDTLAVTLAGTTAESSRRVLRAFPIAEHATASVFGAGGGLTDGEAALVNGAMAHSLELDDDHRLAVLHPGAVVIPAAFAVGEATAASGTRFLQGVLAGYEVACRVGEVFRGSLFQYGLHPTAVCGVFGAAAAAGVILGLDSDAHTRALGIAGTQAAGLTEWREDGSWIKRLHPGRAAQSGVIAARLAKEGFTGPATIFEGEGGYFKAIGHDGPMDRDALTRDLNSDYRALGTAVKPYPCCRFAHGAIDLAIAARRAGQEPRRAGAVGVRIYRSGVLTYRHRPLNSVDAQFNVPYLVAVALSQGRVGLNDFTEAAVQRPEILDLAARVRVVEDERFTAEYPDKYLTELTIEGDGDYRGLSECPSGDPEAARYAEDPDLMRREVTEKIATLLEETGFGERSASLIDLVDGLDAASDLSELAELLRRSPGAKRHSRSVS